MRYLKSYKLFENNSDIKSYINDIFLELKDRGLFTFIMVGDKDIKVQLSNINLEVKGNLIGVEFGAISDDEVNSIMKECQETLEGFDCQMTFFIGRGMSEGRSWDTEFSDINKMVNKTVKNVQYGSNVNCIRNIIVKIKALGGIEE
jgi:hypothetical protein